ncbi:MAG: acyl carrier protein [Rhodocyclaceae bacterium]|jgi:acyl carrier protein
MDALEVIRSFLNSRLGVDPVRVTADATLDELQIDSLILLELFFEFEDKFNLVPPQNPATPKTIAALLKVVEDAQRATTAG